MQRKTIADDLNSIERMIQADAGQQDTINLRDEGALNDENLLTSSLTRSVAEAAHAVAGIGINQYLDDINSYHSSDDESSHSSSSSSDSSRSSSSDSASSSSSDDTSNDECSSTSDSTPSEEIPSPPSELVERFRRHGIPEETPSPPNELADVDLFPHAAIAQDSILLFLPEEIILQIFHLLSMKDCLNLRETCLSLAAIGHDQSLASKFRLRLDYGKNPISTHCIPLPDSVRSLHPLQNNKLVVVFTDGLVGVVDTDKRLQQNEFVMLNNWTAYQSVDVLPLKNGIVAVLENKRSVNLVDLNHFPVINEKRHAGWPDEEHDEDIEDMVAVDANTIAIRLKYSYDVLFYRVTSALDLVPTNQLKINKPGGTRIAKIHALDRHLLVCHDRAVDDSFVLNNVIELYQVGNDTNSLEMQIKDRNNHFCERQYGIISKNKFWYTEHGEVITRVIVDNRVPISAHFVISYLVAEGNDLDGIQHVNGNYYVIPDDDEDNLISYNPQMNLMINLPPNEQYQWRQSVDGLVVGHDDFECDIQVLDLYNSCKPGRLVQSNILLNYNIHRASIPINRESFPKSGQLARLKDGRLMVPARDVSLPLTGHRLMLFDYPARVIECAQAKRTANSVRKP